MVLAKLNLSSMVKHSSSWLDRFFCCGLFMMVRFMNLFLWPCPMSMVISGIDSATLLINFPNRFPVLNFCDLLGLSGSSLEAFNCPLVVIVDFSSHSFEITQDCEKD